MNPLERKKQEDLLSGNYIHRGGKRVVIKDKEGKQVPITDQQKVTGLDETGGIVDVESDNIHEYDCQDVAEGRLNYGGKCAICGATFCNKILNDKPTCYRKCSWCHLKICMRHVRGREGHPVYCSVKCFFLANPIIIAGLIIGITVIISLIIASAP
ncbi:hypothetical protein KKC91_03805 [bacterium]|nr:hypothetical protein [bacterium]